MNGAFMSLNTACRRWIDATEIVGCNRSSVMDPTFV